MKRTLRLPPLPALAAYLLEGSAGRPLDASHPAASDGGGAAAVDYLRRLRIAPEAAASPRLQDSGLPPTARRALALEREQCRIEGARYERTLARCGSALAESGVVALLYKGCAVTRLTHRDPSRRPMGDLDLIVAASARRGARDALLAAGFDEIGEDRSVHDVYVDPETRVEGRTRGVAVELHHQVFPPPHPFSLDLEGAADRGRPADLPGLVVPSRSDAIVLGAFHLFACEGLPSKLLVGLRDLALLARAGADESEDDLRRELAERCEATDMSPLVRGLGRRAADWAGAPSWLGDGTGRCRQASRRRGLAVALALHEIDGGLRRTDDRSARMFQRGIVAALWQESTAESCRQLLRGFVGTRRRGFGRSLGLARRYAAAWLRART